MYKPTDYLLLQLDGITSVKGVQLSQCGPFYAGHRAVEGVTVTDAHEEADILETADIADNVAEWLLDRGFTFKPILANSIFPRR